MKTATIITCLCIFLSAHAYSQPQESEPFDYNESVSVPVKKSKLNFFVISKRKKGQLDLASRFNVFRSKVKGLFRKKKFIAIVAENGEEASNRMIYFLEKYDGRIGTTWFDSHGMYKKGYSLFFIGHDEYNYKTFEDSSARAPFERIAAYADSETRIVIGSCYGGATYNRPSIDYRDTTRMNGDSLMMAMGKLFSSANIYASESWVMTKPGLFLQRAAVAGSPGRKLFLDLCYEPAWQNVGRWNEYNATTGKFNSVNPVTLDMYGNAIVRTLSYVDKKEVRKDIAKNLSKLQPGLYK